MTIRTAPTHLKPWFHNEGTLPKWRGCSVWVRTGSMLWRPHLHYTTFPTPHSNGKHNLIDPFRNHSRRVPDEQPPIVELRNTICKRSDESQYWSVRVALGLVRRIEVYIDTVCARESKRAPYRRGDQWPNSEYTWKTGNGAFACGFNSAMMLILIRSDKCIHID